VTTARTRATVATAVLAAAALLLTACSPQQHVVKGSEVTIVTDQPFTSSNPATSYGNTSANRTIAYATNARFNAYDSEANLERDTSFGSYEKVSDDPLTVKYTIASGVTWSDGVAVDAADLLLSWAANSGALSTPDFEPADHVDAATGRFAEDYPSDVVYFDGAPVAGLSRVSQTPEVSSDNRSITLVYDEYFVDWELAFQVGVPAHVVASEALRLDDPAEAKAAVLDAIQSESRDLAPLSRAWNDAFNFDSMPGDESLLVSSGPYTVTAIEPGESVTLTANPRYRGRNQPSIETVRFLTLADPLAAATAIEAGEADVATPTATSDVLAAFDGLDGVTVEASAGGTWEHLDLQFSNGRTAVFEDPLVREAFLKTVPREAIIEELLAPVLEGASVLDSFVYLEGAEGYERSVAANGSSAYADVDIAGAQALLAEAEIEEPSVCILFDPANPRRVAEYSLIKESAALAGFRVTNCSKAGWSDFLGVPGAYDAALFGWNTTNLALSAPQARLGSESEISNFSHYANPEVDEKLAELAVSVEPGAQRDILDSLDSALWADAYGLPLYQYPVVTVVSDRVTGVVNSPLEPGIVWNLWDWEPSADSESSTPSR
jgi:peptide/nickel transport system substrate-binding protein